MERMEETTDSLPYHQYQHFLSNSPWSHEALIYQVGQDANKVMLSEQDKTGEPTGLLVDESSHPKKGQYSVGVARQYAGTLGKVDNCQVGVYASLVNGTRSTLLNERLFLPSCWTGDEDRCEKAGIPKDLIAYKTKPELALEMVDTAIAEGISFDWVGGDGLYGHNYELCSALENRNVLFVLDVHKDQRIYEEEPPISIPPKKTDKGRPPTLYKSDKESIEVQQYQENLENEDWQKVKIRKTTKGWLKAWVHCKPVWVWDKKESKAHKRTLIIRKTIGKHSKVSEIKYSLSNGTLEDYTIEQFAYFQAQRYWVERNFDDAKNELGMSDYQVRKWKAWHHHHAIVLMAMLFMLKEQIDHESSYPLMSIADARKMVLALIAQSIVQPKSPVQQEINRMKKRHSSRQKSIDWHFQHK
jgi:SRSO17 transposase